MSFPLPPTRPAVAVAPQGVSPATAAGSGLPPAAPRQFLRIKRSRRDAALESVTVAAQAGKRGTAAARPSDTHASSGEGTGQSALAAMHKAASDARADVLTAQLASVSFSSEKGCGADKGSSGDGDALLRAALGLSHTAVAPTRESASLKPALAPVSSSFAPTSSAPAAAAAPVASVRWRRVATLPATKTPSALSNPASATVPSTNGARKGAQQSKKARLDALHAQALSVPSAPAASASMSANTVFVDALPASAAAKGGLARAAASAAAAAAAAAAGKRPATAPAEEAVSNPFPVLNADVDAETAAYLSHFRSRPGMPKSALSLTERAAAVSQAASARRAARTGRKEGKSEEEMRGKRERAAARLAAGVGKGELSESTSSDDDDDDDDDDNEEGASKDVPRFSAAAAAAATAGSGPSLAPHAVGSSSGYIPPSDLSTFPPYTLNTPTETPAAGAGGVVAGVAGVKRTAAPPKQWAFQPSAPARARKSNLKNNSSAVTAAAEKEEEDEDVYDIYELDVQLALPQPAAAPLAAPLHSSSAVVPLSLAETMLLHGDTPSAVLSDLATAARPKAAAAQKSDTRVGSGRQKRSMAPQMDTDTSESDEDSAPLHVDVDEETVPELHGYAGLALADAAAAADFLSLAASALRARTSGKGGFPFPSPPTTDGGEDSSLLVSLSDLLAADGWDEVDLWDALEGAGALIPELSTGTIGGSEGSSLAKTIAGMGGESEGGSDASIDYPSDEDDCHLNDDDDDDFFHDNDDDDDEGYSQHPYHPNDDFDDDDSEDEAEAAERAYTRRDPRLRTMGQQHREYEYSESSNSDEDKGSEDDDEDEDDDSPRRSHQNTNDVAVGTFAPGERRRVRFTLTGTPSSSSAALSAAIAAKEAEDAADDKRVRDALGITAALSGYIPPSERSQRRHQAGRGRSKGAPGRSEGRAARLAALEALSRRIEAASATVEAGARAGAAAGVVGQPAVYAAQATGSNMDDEEHGDSARGVKQQLRQDWGGGMESGSDSEGGVYGDEGNPFARVMRRHR